MICKISLLGFVAALGACHSSYRTSEQLPDTPKQERPSSAEEAEPTLAPQTVDAVPDDQGIDASAISTTHSKEAIEVWTNAPAIGHFGTLEDSGNRVSLTGLDRQPGFFLYGPYLDTDRVAKLRGSVGIIASSICSYMPGQPPCPNLDELAFVVDMVAKDGEGRAVSLGETWVYMREIRPMRDSHLLGIREIGRPRQFAFASPDAQAYSAIEIRIRDVNRRLLKITAMPTRIEAVTDQ